MKRNYVLYCLIGLLIISVSACNKEDTGQKEATISATQALQTAKSTDKVIPTKFVIKHEIITNKYLLASKLKVYSKEYFDLSKILVARFLIGDMKIDVSSIKPVIIRSSQSQSTTIFAFDKNRERLIFYTANKAMKNASEVIIPVSELKKDLIFDFLIVNSATGKIEKQTIQLIELKQK